MFRNNSGWVCTLNYHRLNTTQNKNWVKECVNISNWFVLNRNITFALDEVQKQWLHEFVCGLCLLWKWILPLSDASSLSGHEGEVTQRFHSNVSVRNFAETLSLPDVHSHHWWVVVLDPLDVSGFAVHSHNQPVPIGHKVGHFCKGATSDSWWTPCYQNMKPPMSQTVEEPYCIWCHHREGWRRNLNR